MHPPDLDASSGPSAPRIAVTGASGFVGRALTRRLTEQGVRHRAVSRRPAGDHPDSHRLVDIGSADEWATALRGCDRVVHLAARVHVMADEAPDPLAAFRAVNVAGTQALLDGARRAGVTRMVFVSTIKVHGERTVDRPLREDDPLQPEDAYGRSKAEAEEVVRQAEGIETVIVRPPLIYGPGVSANFLRLMGAVDRGLPLPFGAVHNARTITGLTNLASLLQTCAEHPAAAGHAFLAVDGPPFSTPDLVRALARSLHTTPRLVPVPPWLLIGASSALGKGDMVRRLVESLVADGSKAKSVLGWTPVSRPEQEMDRMARWYRSRGETPGAS